ncbi:HAD domain-containing protein [Oceanobacillus alkalisoli]|uniref:HAD domain-containing protein n=1 Tax=Oceanobacillus alkalisoli TaxID=2925113 RepID=UPI001EE9F7D0|nr:HAD domain-containing protein [Oceanobacillus alkalisoli]MCF3942291.1 hypothetical protein [Oceanobacillus alkalisoli]MCG5104527.1 HAD domain-containing protein [Oceanobacillus alkalisoli]
MINKVLIYLDFDGVLTTKFSNPSKFHLGLEFDPVCIENLKKLLKELKDKYDKIIIVIISNWRYDLSEDQLVQLLCKVYGLEPYFSEIEFADKKGNREEEIKEHLAMNTEVEAFFILDDMNYRDEILRRHLIRTRSEDGIRAFEDIKAYALEIIDY